MRLVLTNLTGEESLVLMVKTAQDVERLCHEGALKPRYLEYLEELFGQLHGALVFAAVLRRGLPHRGGPLRRHRH